MGEIYDFRIKTRKGEDKPMSDFKGKILLIVNTATGCGFAPTTSPEDIEENIKELL